MFNVPVNMKLLAGTFVFGALFIIILLYSVNFP